MPMALHLSISTNVDMFKDMRVYDIISNMKLFILVLATIAAASARRYDGYQTLRVEPQNDIQLDFLNSIPKELDLDGKITLWAHSRSIEHPVDVLVHPDFRKVFKKALDIEHIKYSVMIDDVQALIDSQSRSDDYKISPKFDYSIYHTYEEIQAWLVEITTAHSPISQQFKIATSSEGRVINGIKIQTGGFGTKKAVYLQGGIHAREWISPATIMYITKSLLENYGVDEDVTEILHALDFYIVPLLNVDGYSYTWSDDRLWRKTRSVNSYSECRGVDANRNYGYEWGGDGGRTNACSELYRGPKAFSEPEVAESTAFLLDVNQDFVCFMDFHSYSQSWLAPWSYSARAKMSSRDKEDENKAAAVAVSALEKVYGTKYIYGPAAKIAYAASGCSVDWGYATLGANYSYMVELRDTGTFSFLLPDNQIVPTGEETLEAVKSLFKHIVEEYT